MRLAEDAVAVRQVRARGVSEAALRRQLAAVPTPRLRRFVFVRRVTIRAGPDRVGRAMDAALTKLADGDGSEMLAFPDLPALAIACARAALSGGLGAWYWRCLDVPRQVAPGEAVAALLTAHPRDAGSAVAALAAHGLLDAVWRTMSDAAATRLTAALVQAAGSTVPAWPSETPPRPNLIPAAALAAEPLLARAAAFWRPVLATLSPRAEPVRTAAVLALLRWSPSLLRTPEGPAWPALLARVAPPVAAPAAAPLESGAPPPVEAAHANHASPAAVAEAPPQTPTDVEPQAQPVPADNLPGLVAPHGEALATGWGGVLFLINALNRLDIATLLEAEGLASPTGWRVLHDLGVALGLPKDEPIAQCLDGQDLETAAKPALLSALRDGLERLYRADGPWPLPLAQLARLRATETHLDLDLATHSVDIDLRLSGLDLDPGWVPWLGRVVTFHYTAIPTHLQRSG